MSCDLTIDKFEKSPDQSWTTTRNIYCAECHADRDNLARQKISMRCDGLDLADMCGLQREDLTAESQYVPRYLR